MFHVPEKYRVLKHPYLETTKEDGNNGAFFIPQSNGRELWIIASDGSYWEKDTMGSIVWEHVSVHIYDGKRTITPRWDEMCKVKDIFWDGEDVVIQFHPRKSEYVNVHKNTLHMWRIVNGDIPTPPKITVG